jgi:hypothetical protein
MIAAILLLACPCVLHAQVVRGRVLEAGTSQPIRLATLELLDDRQKVLVSATADSSGAFRLRGWLAAKYRVRASALGYQPVTSEILELGTGEEFELNIRMAADAVPLEPITVVSRARSSLTDIAMRGYYDRRDSGRRIGMGRFLDRGEIQQKGTRLTDVLRQVPGLRIVPVDTCGLVIAVTSNPGGTNRLSGGGGCRTGSICPANLYLDGLLLSYGGLPIDQMVPMEWIEAIEVYRRPSELPAEFLSSGACGVVAVWTRRG